MKKILLIATILICLVFMFSCTNTQKTLDEEFGFSKDDFVVIEEQDTHGGFLGDGTYYLILDCSENQEKVNEIISDWNELPFTEGLNLIMYGGTKDKTRYGSYFASDKITFPKIENGYYMVLDRNDGETRNIVNDLGYHASRNFTIAVYDTDNKTMYYFEYDS